MNLSDKGLFRQRCYIDGSWTDAEDGRTVDVTNPANGAVLGTVPNAGATETRREIEAADRAMVAWRARTGKDRAAVLRRWFELIMANQEDLARIVTAEQGKLLAESRGEIADAA